MKARYSPAWIGALVAAAVVTASTATAQDRDLSAARELYASAAYEDALVALNRLRSSDHPPSQSPIIEQYRAFRADENILWADIAVHQSYPHAGGAFRNAAQPRLERWMQGRHGDEIGLQAQ